MTTNIHQRPIAIQKNNVENFEFNLRPILFVHVMSTGNAGVDILLDTLLFVLLSHHFFISSWILLLVFIIYSVKKLRSQRSTVMRQIFALNNVETTTFNVR
jgi:hypothetical protein